MLIKNAYKLTIFLTLVSCLSLSQSSQVFVLWQGLIGGSGQDVLEDMVEDANGNTYFVGSTQTYGSQMMNILVSKYSPQGQEVWTKTIGEVGDDRGIAIELLDNKLFVLASSNSSTGAFTGNMGREDIVLIQLDINGQMKGMSLFGGNLTDIPSDITKTDNGELLIAAYSESTEGTLDTNKGQFDMWVIRLDSSRSIIWSRNYGGIDDDFSSKINELTNGEIVLSGHSSSYSGDIMLNYGDLDLSLLKLTSTGHIMWQQNYGGLQAETAKDLFIEEGRIFLAGSTQSLSHDISKNAGFSDAWIIEVDASDGIILWETTHGSKYGDYAEALSMDESGQLYLIGTTNAPIFQGEETSGNVDAWIAKVNSPNSIVHLALIGGDGYETVSGCNVRKDGAVLLYGSSNSTEQLFSSNKGNFDGWVMSLALNDLQTGENSQSISAHPNPTSGVVYLNNLSDTDKINIYNISGQPLETFSAHSFTEVIDLMNTSSGVYLIQVERSSGTEFIRLVRE